MCPPAYFGVLYEINPWMHSEVRVDPELAASQWEDLVASIRARRGARRDDRSRRRSLPDLVFTANAGVVNGRQFVPARFRHPERQAETPHDVGWFAAHGFAVDHLPEGVRQEGAGDALPFGGVLVAGYRFRSDAASHAYLSRLTGAPVRSVELVDERLYHLDLTFCPLDDRRAIIAPLGWDRYGEAGPDRARPRAARARGRRGDVLLRQLGRRRHDGDHARLPAAVGRQLEAWGFDVAVCPVGEFMKAGGACRCLTLALDVSLADPPATGEGLTGDLAGAGDGSSGDTGS